MNELKLYNMDKREWTGFKPGEHWRVDRIYACEICGCQSNEFYMFAPSYSHPKLVCPGDAWDGKLHFDLQNKVWNSWDKKHPQGYLDMLTKEIEEMRKQFLNVKPNIMGDPKPLDSNSPHWNRKSL